MRSSLALALLLLGSPAGATPNFPGALQQALGAPGAPPCSVCHAGGVTGRGTVTTGFGKAMLSRGLAAGDEGSLRTALASLEADRVDSNGNGVPDVDELRAGNDPSLSGSTPALGYGCSLGGAPAKRPLGALLAAALLLLLPRRRRPRWLSAAPCRRRRA